MPDLYDDDHHDDGAEPANAEQILFHETGMSGLNMAGGRPHEEWLPQLQGQRGAKTYREMVDNDPIIGGIISGYEEVLRSVDWLLIPADNTPQAQAAAEFVDTCREDMSVTWSQLISDILSKLTYGWSYFEVVYKRRQGRTVESHAARSRFDDGLIGWRKIALRGQDTIDHWETDHHGGIQGMWQKVEQGTVFLPIERCLLFRTTAKKNNPEGRSVLRNAYTSYWSKKRVEEFELIGIERDLAGIPSFGLPPAMFDPGAPSEVKNALDDYKRAASQLRRDEQSSLVWPMYRDENGNMEIEIGLLKSPGTRQHNTEAVIERYARYMAISTLQDVIMMGHEQVGSFALAETKKQMSLASMRTQLDEIASVFNRYELPRLLALNGIDEALTPTLRPGEITERDLVQLAQIIKATSDAGFAWFPNESVQNELLTMLGFDPIAFNSDADSMTVAPSIPAESIASVDDDMDTVAEEGEEQEADAEVGLELAYRSGTGGGGGGGGGGGISAADEERLRAHAANQTPAHIAAMRRFMRQGMSFAAAHRAATNMIERAAPDEAQQLIAAIDSVTITKESFSPTDAMKVEARRGLDWRRQFGRGGTQVGVSRARDIINRDLSELSVRRMYSFFARHEVDKQAEGFSPGEEGYPSAGRIAWALWGGDAGQRWSTRIVERLDRMRIEKELGEGDADADVG